jgi:hypothetical protein
MRRDTSRTRARASWRSATSGAAYREAGLDVAGMLDERTRFPQAQLRDLAA